MENIEKKEISEKTAVKAFINGFIAYGIIFGFIVLMITAFFSWILQNSSIINQNLQFLVITSILRAILFYFLILFVCRISTFDVLKKCKINKENIKSILNKMTIFFTICGVFSIMVCSLNLSVKYLNLRNDLYLVSSDNYNSFKDYNINIATELTNQEAVKSRASWLKYKVSLGITETAILFTCCYLTFYQKKMILLYNTEK